ncbi:CDK5 regulatory subunit-associated protein 2-like [Microtus pennsylvanicus]|uniref:CDK5 regulatory subunit-associated protein 2-like n=1 Tax=Microtus pennsylvanicus TaxID=10058 RepID=UPI003F6D7776
MSCPTSDFYPQQIWFLPWLRHKCPHTHKKNVDRPLLSQVQARRFCPELRWRPLTLPCPVSGLAGRLQGPCLLTPPGFRSKTRRKDGGSCEQELGWKGRDLGSPAGRDSLENLWRRGTHLCHRLCVHDGLGDGRGRHPAWDPQRLQNIELKVEVESLKQKLQERDQLLISASKAVESLTKGGGSEVQRVKEDARRKVQQVEDLLTERIHLLEEDVKAAQAELEKAFAETETEKAFRLSLESKLSEMKKMQEQDLELTLALEDKDRLIEELKLSLKSKEALIQCLQEEKSQMASPDENVSSGELRGLAATLREAKERDAEAAQREWQKERNHWEEKIQVLV